MPYILLSLSRYLKAVVRVVKSLPAAFKDAGEDSPLERIEKLETEVRELRTACSSASLSRVDFLENLGEDRRSRSSKSP
jgi:hypothetical protein